MFDDIKIIYYMAKEYIVKEGDTLWGIAQRELGSGARWPELGRQLGITTEEQARRLPIGAKLTIPDIGVSLKGTATGTLAEPKELPPAPKELPAFPADNLSMFQNLLRRVTQRYAQEATAAGMAITGIEPSKISGATLAGIVNFIKAQKTEGIADIYTSTVDLLKNTRQQAEKQLNTLINEGALAQLNDEQLTRLSNMSGMDFDFLMGIRKAQTEERARPKSFAIVEEGGRRIRLGFNEMGRIVSRTDIGEAEEIPTKTFEWKNLTQTLKQDIIAWLTRQEGYDTSWLKKLDEDPDFAMFIVSKYYQQLEEL
ncbi:MAG: hypothetical protein DDT23_01371 [candidate division WS2 bacterium]|nr:hypothetical protein [Candidatus Lithacetigena glycinireducens]